MHGIGAGLGAAEYFFFKVVFAAGVHPIVQENVLQPAYCCALQAHMGVAVGGAGKQVLVFGVADVDATRKAYCAIAHDDFAVGAQIDQRAPAVEPSGVKYCQLATCSRKLPAQSLATPAKEGG